MALLNTSLPNLIQGVSQQPDATRFSGQCDEQINFTSSVVDGLTKRNGTRFINKLFATDSAISADSFIHFINRSEEERYVLIHDGTKVHAYNTLSGEEATINGATGGYTTAGTYLDVSHAQAAARDLLRATTVSDGTFLVNRAKTVAVDTTTRSADLAKEAMIFVKQGDYEKEYSLEINYSSETPATASLALTYTRGDGNKYSLTSTSTVSVSNGGSGYANGDVYSVVSYPATVTVGSDVLDLHVLTGDTTTVEVTSDTQGTITSGTVFDSGSKIAFSGTNALRSVDVGPTITITVTLEESPGLGGVTKYDNTATIKVYSENSTQAMHADTSRITELIAKGVGGTYALDIEAYNSLHHGTGNSVHDAADNFGLDEAFPNLIAGTNAEFTMEREGNLIVLSRTASSSDFTIKASDGLGGDALGVVYKEVGAITDLPLYAKNGFRVKVRGDGDLTSDDYYVEFKTDDQNQSIGPGSWVETTAPGIVLNYDSATLPLFISSTGENSFNLTPLKTAPRIVGDDISNPFASFAGKAIQNSVFFKNRLGFVCEKNVILSEAGLGSRNDSGEFEYNFGRTTVTSLLDSDPIDVIVEAQRVVNLTAAATSQENLILFSNNGQFVLKGEDLLTPRTVSVKPITNFEYNGKTDPVSVGSYIYYPFDLGNNTGIREFSLNKTTDVYESTEITEQVPRYIPKNITYFSGSLSENTLAILSKDDDQCLYVYKYFYSEGRKVLSSWFKWEFGVNIKGFEFMDSTLYLLATDDTAGETYLLNMPLNFDGEDEELVRYTLSGPGSSGYEVTALTKIATPFDDIHVTHLDMRTPAIAQVATGGYTLVFPEFSAGTTKPLKENIAFFNDANPVPLTFTAETVVYSQNGIKIPSTLTPQGQIFIDDDDADLSTGTPLWVGFEFDSKYVFSEQIFKAQAGQARTPNASAKQRIKNLSIYHAKTSDYQIKVTPDKRSTYTNTFEATTRSFYDADIGQNVDLVDIKQGFYKAPIFSSTENLVISLENNGAMPSNFQSAEFETFVHTRSRRYGI